MTGTSRAGSAACSSCRSRATATCGCASSPPWPASCSATSPAGSDTTEVAPGNEEQRGAAPVRRCPAGHRAQPGGTRLPRPAGPVDPVPAHRRARTPSIPPCPPSGKWLTFLADSADQPGSALLADLTSLLAEHWATGQSPLEDASLAAQLAWIDPPPGMTGLQAALATEDPLRCPPAGPATDPGFDQAILEPLVRNYDRAARPAASAGTDRAAAEITSALSGQLEPTWDAAWHAISLLRALPETAGAGRRWAADRDSFTRFSSYLADGGLPQPRRDHAAIAAARLDRLERAQAAYDAERALEDPFVLAELRTTGEAFAGDVVSAEPARTDHHRGRPDRFCGPASPSAPAIRCASSPAGC